MKLGDIARHIGAQGQLDEASARFEPSGFSIDSRTIRAGELFFAICGRLHNGHQFLAPALEKAACGAVISQDVSRHRLPTPHGPLLKVRDTLVALQTLARTVREQWGGTVIGITGSSGKTMTKEMTAEVLTAGGMNIVKTMGNYNNNYGLPLSLLQLISADVRSEKIGGVVLEMGMNAAGEIAHLCTIAQPNIGIITNVSSAHLESFPDVEAIAEAKAELIDQLDEDGVAILNSDDQRVASMRFRRLISSRTFGLIQPADITALEIESGGLDGSRFKLKTPRGVAAATLPLMGRHNIYNALAAVAVGEHFELPLERLVEGLSRPASLSMRGEIMRFPQGFTVINDGYNSNPRALDEMVATVCATNHVARRIIVAGEMLELGPQGPELHRRCGQEMARRGVDVIIGVRGLAREIVAGAHEDATASRETYFFETPEAAARLLFDILQKGDLVLVKGSRSVHMERAIDELQRLCDRTE